MFKGDKTKFGNEQLAIMDQRKNSAHIRTPHEMADNLQKGVATGGEQIYQTYCVSCHLIDGRGDESRFPPLEGSEFVLGDKNRLINILLNGMQQPITVKGKLFNGLMPSHRFLPDKDIALVLSYIRQNFNNKSTEILPAEVEKERIKSITKK